MASTSVVVLRPSALWVRRTAGYGRSALGTRALPTLAVIALSALVIVGGWARLAADAPGLSVAIESLAALSGGAAIALTCSRFATTRELRDLFLLGATATLTLTVVIAYALPAALGLSRGGVLVAAGPWGELFAAAGFVAYAAVPCGWLVPLRWSPLLTIVLAASAVLIAALAGWPLQPWLTATGPRLRFALADASLPEVALGIASALLFLGAGLMRRREDLGPTTRPWLEWALLLLGVAALYRVKLPVIPADWISARDPLRLGAMLMILAAAVRRERDQRQYEERVAVIAERQRVARDLHDGIAQDLAFIAAYTASLGDGRPAEHPLYLAAQRALAITRGVINDLADLDNRPAREALAVVARELSTRFQISIAVDVHGDDDDLPRDVQRDLVRIVREAIANAARHGSAEHVTVMIERRAGGTVLRVRDDGRGIFAADGTRAPEGYGLSSMREQTAAMGARLALSTPPRGGTELMVSLP